MEIANRDPSVFPSPDDFDIDRDTTKHVRWEIAISLKESNCIHTPLLITRAAGAG